MSQNRKLPTGREYRPALFASVNAAALSLSLVVAHAQTAQVPAGAGVTSGSASDGFITTDGASFSSQQNLGAFQTSGGTNGGSTSIKGDQLQATNSSGGQSSLQSAGVFTNGSIRTTSQTPGIQTQIAGDQITITSADASVIGFNTPLAGLPFSGINLTDGTSALKTHIGNGFIQASGSLLQMPGTTTIEGGKIVSDQSAGNGGKALINGSTAVFDAAATNGGQTQINGGSVTVVADNGKSVFIDGKTGALSLDGGARITGGLQTDTLTSADAKGNTGNLTGGLLTLTNSGNPNAKITLDATVDPVLTVSNGTAAGTTAITNGDVAVGNSVTVGTSATNQTVINNGAITANSLFVKDAAVSGNLTVGGTASVAGQAFLAGGATVSNNLTVNPGANVSMGGNVVRDVATPAAGTDAANKAYVDTAVAGVNRRIDRADQGIAIAMAVQNPILTGGDRFGISVNWGDFAGNNAVGLAAAGVVGQNLFGTGEKMAVTGGFGFGTGGHSENQVSGRAGFQFTW
jgi:hypothetical protein